MLTDSILTLTTFVPIAGAVVVALLPRKGRLIQWWTLLVSLITFLLTLHLPFHYVYGQQGFQFEENAPWIASPKIGYHLGIDGLSMWLVVLTGFLSVIGVLASWNAIEKRTKEFYFLFLIQQTAMIGVFVALDMFLYYGFWELSLVPMAILIAIFGPERGPKTALKFFSYTFIPSALFLVAILWLYARTGTFDYVAMQHSLTTDTALFAPQALWWVSLAFLVAFAVKVPVFPLHGWLSDTIYEAPTAMAMVVAGKLGLYSIIRFVLGLFPAQARIFAPLMIALAVIGILYGACLALAQTNIRRLVVYAMLSALSFCTLGIFCFSLSGLDGAVFQILNEGLSGSAFLILVGFLHERYGTYEISQFGGLTARLPNMATFYVITALSLIGLPILNGFIGEFLVLSGSFGPHRKWAALATIGVILSAAYMLWMIQRVFYGPQSPLVTDHVAPDIIGREYAALVPMILLMFAMGVASPYWMRAINEGVAGFADTIPSTATHAVTNSTLAEKR